MWGSNPLSKLSIGVFQTSAVSEEYDGTGFISARSSSGSFTHRFDKPGVYYFSTGPIDAGKRISMTGRVIVRGMKSKISNVHLRVGRKFPVKSSLVSYKWLQCLVSMFL